MPVIDEDFIFAELDHLRAHVKIAVNKRAKRLALRLDSKDRKIRFTIPPRCPIKKARLFLLQNESWVLGNIDKLPPLIPLTHGQIIPVFGHDRRINISYEITLKRTDITLNKNEITIKTNKDDPTPRLVRFLKKEAEKELTRLTKEKAAQIDKTVAAVQVRDTKSRWGSCGHDSKISFSWRLIFAPHTVLDYVVAHEVAHLQHMDHSRAFWACCKSLCEDYTYGKSWLHENGNELMRYDA